MTKQLHQPHTFTLQGSIAPLVKCEGGVHTPSRPFGGWLMTYGQIEDDGTVIPTQDRDGQIMEAARELGRIDWSPYLSVGLWNDTHDERLIVGVPTKLEFHDGTTELSKAHRKVGYWTEGHLFDRDDPASWRLYTAHEPTPADLDKADRFWTTAAMLKGLPRPLGFSAHGSMVLSPCRKRILWCQVRQAAVCDLPKNPDATAFMLKGSPLDLLAMRKGVPRAGGSPCERCLCTEPCAVKLRKASEDPGRIPTSTDGALLAPDDIEMPTAPSEQLELLIQRMRDRYFLDRETALRFIRRYILRRARTNTEQESTHGNR